MVREHLYGWGFALPEALSLSLSLQTQGWRCQGFEAVNNSVSRSTRCIHTETRTSFIWSPSGMTDGLFPFNVFVFSLPGVGRPVSYWVDFRILLLVFGTVVVLASPYLQHLLHRDSLLKSNNQNLLHVPWSKYKSKGAFSVMVSRLWNKQPSLFVCFLKNFVAKCLLF